MVNITVVKLAVVKFTIVIIVECASVVKITIVIITVVISENSLPICYGRTRPAGFTTAIDMNGFVAGSGLIPIC